MIDRIYLMYHSYLLNEILEVGILERKEKGYSYMLGKDSEKAELSGCMIPFRNPVTFDVLPDFFTQRMVSGAMLSKMNLSYNPKDDLSILAASRGIKNSDNFFIFTEIEYAQFKDENKQFKK